MEIQITRNGHVYLDVHGIDKAEDIIATSKDHAHWDWDYSGLLPKLEPYHPTTMCMVFGWMADRYASGELSHDHGDGYTLDEIYDFQYEAFRWAEQQQLDDPDFMDYEKSLGDGEDQRFIDMGKWTSHDELSQEIDKLLENGLMVKHENNSYEIINELMDYITRWYDF